MGKEAEVIELRVSVPFGTATQLLAPSQRKRKRVYIGSPPTNRITLSVDGPPILDAGINIPPGLAPFVLENGSGDL